MPAVVLGALPLLAYPFVVLANIMSLTGYQAVPDSLTLIVVKYGFLLLITVYPVVYVFCMIKTWRTRHSGPPELLLKFSFAPLGYLALVAVFYMIWDALS